MLAAPEHVLSAHGILDCKLARDRVDASLKLAVLSTICNDGVEILLVGKLGPVAARAASRGVKVEDVAGVRRYRVVQVQVAFAINGQVELVLDGWRGGGAARHPVGAAREAVYHVGIEVKVAAVVGSHGTEGVGVGQATGLRRLGGIGRGLGRGDSGGKRDDVGLDDGRGLNYLHRNSRGSGIRGRH